MDKIEYEDLRSAIQVGEMVITNAYHKNKMITIFNDLPKKWQKKITDVTREHSQVITDILMV